MIMGVGGLTDMPIRCVPFCPPAAGLFADANHLTVICHANPLCQV